MRNKIATFLSASLLLLPHFASGADQTITGTTRLAQDTYIRADTITFADGALIVTNGFRLTLEGTTKIIFQGTPKVISFENRPSRPAGDPGRSGGPIIVQTPLLGGTRLRLEDVGEPGTKGADGSPGAQGPKGGQGTQRDWNAWNGCIGGSDGRPGGQGGDGGPGGRGGNGGAGGTIIFNVKAGFWNGTIARLDMVVTGAAPGAAGTRGAAGAGGAGGDGAPGTFYCGNTNPGPAGPAGRPGLEGVVGAPGNAGTILDINNNSLPATLSAKQKAHYLGMDK